MGLGVRLTRHINEPVTQSAFRAFDYAKATGRRLNTYVVINLRDEATCSAATAFGMIRHKFRDWSTYRGKKLGKHLQPIYVYTFENPDGHVHVNWAVHVPDGMENEFKKKLEGWVEKVQGPLRPFDVHIQPIDADSDKTLAKYMLKGTDPCYVKHFYMEKVHVPQGIIWGRRAGVSQAIGISARKRDNFHPGRRRPYRPSHTANADQGVDYRVAS